MRAEKAPVRKCIALALSPCPAFQFFSISVKAEAGALAEKGLSSSRQGHLWEGRLRRAEGELSHFKNT